MGASQSYAMSYADDGPEPAGNVVSLKRVQPRAELEGFHRVCNMVITFWGYPEFASYIENLILVERERTSRAGFPPAVTQELMFLYQLDRDQGSLVNRDMTSQGVLAMENTATDAWHLSR